VPDDINIQDSVRRIMLHWAADRGHKGVVKLLLDEEIKYGVADSNKDTPLSLAAKGGHVKVMLLIEWKVSVNSATSDGRTPLCSAAGHGHDTIVKILIENRARPSLAARSGFPRNCITLVRAVCNSQKLVVEVLLEHGSNPYEPVRGGQTILDVAVNFGKGVITKLL